MTTQYTEAVKILGLLAVEDKNWRAAQTRLGELFEAATAAEASLAGYETRRKEVQNLEAEEKVYKKQRDQAQKEMNETLAAQAKLEKELSDDRANERKRIDEEIKAQELRLKVITQEIDNMRKRLTL